MCYLVVTTQQVTAQRYMQQEIFQAEHLVDPQWYIFKKATEIGSIHSSIPWSELGACLPEEVIGGKGAPRWLSNEGMIALMFLKSFSGLSDQKLIERFNTDWSYQFFCGKKLSLGEKIKDVNLPSRVRSYIADNADLDKLQSVLLNHWKADMDNTHVLFMDATCYESYVRFPTDIKLLWESCQFIFEKLIFKLCKLLNTKRPRSKYVDQKRKQTTYSKLRKKSYKKGRSRKKSLLHLLKKGIDLLQELLNTNPEINLRQIDYQTIRTIKRVFQQQRVLFHSPGTKVSDRIISLHKPYLRPIVRGKENKPVEFGMKAHMLQTDGITWFESLQYKAFNECKRLKISCIKHKHLFGKCNQVAGDQIYATNENRRYLTNEKVFHSFPKKGPKTLNKSERELKSALNKVRSTDLEGSFGNHKNHYGLRKVKAKTAKNEKVWVFFGVMAANAVKMTNRKIATLQGSPPTSLAA